MKKVIKILLVILFLNIIGICSNRVSAQTSMAMKASINAQDINAGDEITINLYIDDLVEIGEGINAYVLTLNFNTEQFEFVKVEGQNGWNSPAYNSNSLVTGKVKLVATRQAFTTEKGDVLKITLKSKQNYTVSDILDIKITDASFAAKINGTTTKIQISEELKLNMVNDGINGQIITEKDKDKEKEETAGQKKDVQSEPPVFPNAGKYIGGSIIMTIIIVSSFIFYYKYRKMNKYIK